MKYLPLFIGFLLSIFAAHAQDTFSIVAVDPETGEVGSAGATCVPGIGSVGGVILLSGIVPGRGGINAQAWICINPHINLDNALMQMEEGLAPQEIIDWLLANDDCSVQNFDPSYRQYGIVDFGPNEQPRTAAHSGSNADDWKGHITGTNYAIQGNILRGPEVLEAMEANFLAAEGPLAVKLMAAMQGANMVGADARCTDAGTSSTSAFLRVFRPNDRPNGPYLELNVAEAPTGVEPIDSLQALFDEWLLTGTKERERNSPGFRAHPNPANGYVWLSADQAEAPAGSRARLYDLQGRLLWEYPFLGQRMRVELPARGAMLLQVVSRSGRHLYSQRLVNTE